MKDATTDSTGMAYLTSLPRRVVTVWVPLSVFLFVLLFPFYWMVVTTFKPNEELLSREGNPFWVRNPTLAHVKKLLFDTAYPEWLWNTMVVSVVSTLLSLACSVFAASAIERLRFRGSRHVGMAIFLAYLVPPSILFIPLAAIVFQAGLFDSRLALILTYPTFLIPFCTWLLMGYFKSIPYELEECALIDGASRWQILVRIILPLAVPGILAGSVLVFCAALTSFVTPQVLGQGKISTFATIAYQQAALVLDWPFASALAVSLLVMLGIALGIFAGLRRLALLHRGAEA